MIYIGSDHGGYGLKEKLGEKLREWGYDAVDLSPKLEEGDDYPDAAVILGEKVVKDKVRGILVCRSGVGMCIAANKVKGVRAGLAFEEKQVQMAREHNDINVLCLSADWIEKDKNLAMAKIFLEGKFNGEERHIRRVNKISAYESNKR